ncbi:MAG: hypothetical protein HC769_07965 [Cyanobacteria bacterium CRU_2_1]|nr:hypothetical protein [Cyanobacteria bacterium RU_5_0]NJR58786.1 hypothetical protein [Cyanobacteria bacterium CRU_2_1]
MINPFRPTEISTTDIPLDSSLARYTDVIDRVNQLDVSAKVALIQRLMTHLETGQIQGILEFGQQEIAERERHTSVSTADRQTRLLLKKDYTYQERGLSEPTQYYVYLRRRKPKLDRYIGTLFYVPRGCTLSYFPDDNGRILFNPPHNVFQLKDSENPSVTQIVRLICLEPPPADYTFTKQQDDTPDIHLRLEYLDPNTYQPIAEESYPFPICMYAGGKLDRYRWDVSTVTLPSEIAASTECIERSSTTKSLKASSSQPASSATLLKHSANQKPSLQPTELDKATSTPASQADSTSAKSKEAVAKIPRRVIELPASTSATFYLANRCDSTRILERMRLWATWSEKAMPQSKWDVVQDGAVYTLRNTNFKRILLRFSLDQASVTMENSLPVVMKWFHDLGLAASQSQNQRQYSSAQLKLAHSLFVDMSLPQDDPMVVLKKLFGVEFSKTSLYK